MTSMNSRPDMPSFRHSSETIVEQAPRTGPPDSKEKKSSEAMLEAHKLTSTPSSSTLSVEDDCLEGTLRSYLVIFGAMLLGFTFGYVNAWGVFQAYYQENILQSSSPSAIAWIGSSQHACSSLVAPIVGRLFDMGYFRSILITGTVGLVLATFLTAECHVYWQFLLCQGIISGISLGLCDALSLMVIPQWFTKHRGLAYGSVGFGSCLGGIVVPILAQSLLPHVGFSWTMRIFGFYILFTLILCNLTMRSRHISLDNPLATLAVNYFDLRPLKSPVFTVYCLATLVEAVGYYALPTYVVTSAQSIGISSTLSFYLVSILNGSGGVAHIFEGWGADTIGAMNIQIPFTLLTAIMLWIWPFAKTQASLIVVVIFFGLSSDSADTLPSTAVASMGDLGELGRRLGLLNLFLGIGELIGPPLAGKVNQSFGLEAMAFLSGAMVLLGLVLICVSRYLVLRKWTGKV